jgi:hypothetical protein
VQLLTASRKRWEPQRILLARRLPAQPNIPKGTAMVTLRHFSSTCLLASTRAVTTAGIVTKRDGNARSPSSLSTHYGWSSARFGSAARSALSAVRAAGQPAPDGSISAVGADWPLMQANVSLCNSARPTGNIRVYCGTRTQLGATKVASEDPPRTVVNAAMISRVRVA